MTRIEVFSSAAASSALPADDANRVIDDARALLTKRLPPHLSDDRFSDSWAEAIGQPDSGFVAAVARTDSGEPVGITTASGFRDRVLVESIIVPSDDAATDEASLRSLLAATLESKTCRSAHAIEWWSKPGDEAYLDDVAAALSLTPHRTLLQLRCELPVDAPTLDTRSFIPGRDDTALLSVNNRAFIGHPDQGDLSMEEFLATQSEPWFDPQGIRLYFRDGQLAGFCWTKVHHSPEADRLGEIYVIGVDPDFHGQGLGVPMTASGLKHLADQGIKTGMLYVEGDNEPALATYRRLGFTTARTDRAWRKSGPTPPLTEETP